jgi:transposase-like protein
MIIQPTVQQCRKCGSTHIVKNGHNRSGSQQYRCKVCGAIGVLSPKQSYNPARKEEILRAYQERPSMRGIHRIFGVSRKALAAWIKKNSRRCPRCGRRCLVRRPMTNWKSMKSGRLSGNGRGNAGCGRSCLVGPATFLPLSLATTANARVGDCGIGFRPSIGDAPVSATSGRPMRPSSQRKRTAAWGKTRARRRTWNAGIIRFDNAWHGMFAKPCRFRKRIAGMIESPNGLLSPTI